MAAILDFGGPEGVAGGGECRDLRCPLNMFNSDFGVLTIFSTHFPYLTRLFCQLHGGILRRGRGTSLRYFLL